MDLPVPLVETRSTTVLSGGNGNAISGADSCTDAEHEPGSGTRLGDFTLLRRLGRGAQGEVFEAREESLGRLVALKVLPPYLTFSPDRLRRFRREAEAGGRLDHPNTVGVHSVGEFEGYHFIAQELVAGGRTLADRIAEARRQPELPRDWHELMAELFVQVADAVHAAHEAGIIHRDLKPGNILLTRDGQPKVADFGLAMVLDDLHRSRSGELIGTPFYMSPEQAAGSRTGLDRRTDLFSLGATLYEALTLQRPFDGETRESIVEQILQREPREPRRVRPSVPRDLSIICMKALERRAERRYQTAAEFADDLRRWLASEPIRARPPGPVARTGKWLHRHPVRTAFAATFVLVVGLLVLARVQDVELQQQLQYSDAREADLRSFAQLSVRDLFDSLADLEEPQARPEPGSPIVQRIDSVLAQAGMLGGLPEEQAYLFTVAGVSCRDTSLFERADVCFAQALEAVGRMDGNDPELPLVRARVLLELGRLRRWTADWTGAQAALAESHAIFTAARGATSVEAFEPGKVLAIVLYQQGRRDEAEAVLRSSLAADGDADGDGEPALDPRVPLLAAQQLGYLLMDDGRLDQAAELLLPAFERSRSTLPPLEWAQLGSVVAQLQDKRARAAACQPDRPAESQALSETAERLFQESIAELRAQRPDPSERTAEALANFGSFLSERQRYAEARATLEEAVRMGLLKLGPDHRVTRLSRNNLAVLDYREGRRDEAEAGWREILASDRRAPPADTRVVLRVLKNLAKLCFEQQRYPEAVTLATELVERTPAFDRDREPRLALLDRIQAAARRPVATGTSTAK